MAVALEKLRKEISERKLVEQALRESEEKYRILIENANDAIFIAQDEVIKFPNPKTEDITGYSESEIAMMDLPMLERLGYKVTARTSSLEALEAFRNNPDRFDLVVTDQTMPNMTGKELAKELMAIRSRIPIILCTGFSEQIDEKRAKEMGISAFVMKPIVMHDIANTIRSVLHNEI